MPAEDRASPRRRRHGFSSALRPFHVRVNPNPVIAHPWLQVLSVGIREEHFRFLKRHVAIDAVAGYLIAQLRMFSALLGLMTGQTTRRKRGRVALRGVNVVASRAGHSCGCTEASTSPQQLHLIAVNVDCILGAGIRDIDVVLKRVAGKKRQRGSDRRAVAGVAQTAYIDLPVTRKPGRIHDRLRSSHRKRLRAGRS